MREIKFRVWDNDDYMSTPFTLKDLQEGKIKFTDDCQVMEYTGLHDKNGKEIYEGDVIRCSAYQREVNDIYENDIVEVKYSDGYFHPFGYNAGWRSEVYDIEVIGNIHENPELLK